ncbi:hypothetical protein CR513_46230, partial [Mucuna pruriens]
MAIVSQSNSVVSVCNQPRPSRIDLCQDHLSSVSTESNSASAEESIKESSNSCIINNRSRICDNYKIYKSSNMTSENT